jgi:hypothetical protein
MENKQSSVEWYIKHSNRLMTLFKTKQMNAIALNLNLKDLQESAKAMHQKEIIKASARGYVNSSDGFPLQEAINYAEQYYKKTFGK